MTALTTVAFCVGLVAIVSAVLLLDTILDRILGRRPGPACECRACADPDYVTRALTDLERDLRT